ncbi:MAG TPA: hypothetical protein VF452_05895 [Candidatus Binatia bacterium]
MERREWGFDPSNAKSSENPMVDVWPAPGEHFVLRLLLKDYAWRATQSSVGCKAQSRTTRTCLGALGKQFQATATIASVKQAFGTGARVPLERL